MSTMQLAESRRSQTTTRPDPRTLLLAGLPVVERRLSLAGISTAVLEGGTGSPLILLHGPGESAVKWLRVIPELVKTHHVIAPDLPAHGASGAWEKVEADRVFEWLGELIRQTCPSPPTVVGHVLGGAIAARFAVRYPNRIGRLVLVDSLGLTRFRPSPRFALAMIHFLARPNERTYDRFMRQCSHDLDDLRKQMGRRWEPFATYNLMAARSPRSKAVGEFMRMFGLPRIPSEDLARITIPTSLIWGRHDRATRLRIAEEVGARHGWPVYVIEDCADDPARDRPEAFLAALRLASATSSEPTPEAGS